MARVESLRALAVVVMGAVLFSGCVVSSDLYTDSVLKYDEATFKQEIDKAPHIVKFFAPWCGHCKRLAPTWEELAQKYNVEDQKKEVIVAKVDCTSETALCADQGVTGYPTLKFFKPGLAEGVRYRGPRDLASLKSFIEQSLGILQASEDEPKPPMPQHGLLELTDATFQSVVETGQHFVKFYAPWCGHCQKLAPVWKELARSYEFDPSVTIAQVDCTAHRTTCNAFEVKAYPTLLWIVDGKAVEKYQGSRTHEDLKEFVTHMIERIEEEEEAAIMRDDDDAPRETIPDDFTDSDAPVVVLTGSNFDNAIGQGVTFVKFYAPWCGHCQRLAPTWDNLARKFVGNPKVKIAKVDCTTEEDLCNQHKVQGYPTLLIFRNGARVGEFSGARDLSSLHNFIMEHMPHDEL